MLLNRHKDIRQPIAKAAQAEPKASEPAKVEKPKKPTKK